jgi:transcriptional regulator with XRE-family HTH domain
MDQVEELAKRIRAARVYAGLSREELAEHLEVHERTQINTELGKRHVPRPELLAIAEACKVPIWFLEHGWKGWMKEVSPEELRQIADELPPLPGD